MSSENTGANGNGDCLGWAATDESGILSPYKFSRRSLQNDDVSVKITHCGICYADVLFPRNKHGNAKYPMGPGHEIAGIVQEVGSMFMASKSGAVFTYNNVDVDGTITQGGFSSTASGYQMAIHWPQQLLCFVLASLFTLPMMRHKMNQPGKSLGVIGLGGLGHLAVKFGKAFGLNVTVFSTSTSKKEEALTLLGADNFVVSSDLEQMTALAKSLDFIIDTASGDHPFDPYMSLLKTAGVLVLVGAPSEVKLSPLSLIRGMKSISGSATGGTKQTQEMLDFCAAHKIYPNIEIVPIQYVNEALERLIKRDVKYRFVIDVESSLK
ncbi:putative cinnamyl alcohol dehydrogenase 1 [Prunus yedoensis var. nudiflora]|uniref:Putative cinnamyl alcohol dehydrogenase 1 n=1 Tax=Prunus yedoensis var. nudiflora TaxID=2094558 RepID=A0A314V1I9_PRUYE|nr:putative cinnamyl alcohol dehydrogenase 1 [Prunus yedoensis var. nudiflora]